MKKKISLVGGRVSPTENMFVPFPCFAPDDGQGGGTPPDGQSGGEDGAGGPGGGPPAPFYPDGLDEQWKGADDRETITNLGNQITSMRQSISKFGQVPKTADEYDLGLSEDFISTFGIEDKDPGLAAFKQAAHEMGLRGDQSKVVGKFLETAQKEGLIEAPISVEQLMGSLAPKDFKGSPAEMQEAGAKRFREADNFINTFAENKGLTDGAKEFMSMMATDAGGLELLDMFMNDNPTVNPGGDGADDVTEADLLERMNDARNMRGDPKYDPDFAKKTNEMYKAKYS
jgi:hypothetical protein